MLPHRRPSPSGGDGLSPIHLQKTLYSAEQTLTQPLLTFTPGAHGAHDPGIFAHLQRIERHGLAERTTAKNRLYATWRLTARGLAAARRDLGALCGPLRDYLGFLHARAALSDSARLAGATTRAHPQTATCMVLRRP